MRKGKRKKKKIKNKKVINAQPKFYDNIQFRSLLEVFCYKRLKEEGLYKEDGGFQYEKITYTILEGFEYMGEKVRPIKTIPDFIDEQHKIMVEIKGWFTDTAKLKYKLLKRFLHINNMNFTLYMPKNQREVNEVISEIKKKLK